MRRPIRHALRVFALQASRFELRSRQRQGTFHGLGQHEAQLDEIERRRQNVGGHVLGDQRPFGGATRRPGAPHRDGGEHTGSQNAGGDEQDEDAA